MKHIKTINKANLKESAAKGGCGQCQAARLLAPLQTRSANGKQTILIRSR